MSTGLNAHYFLLSRPGYEKDYPINGEGAESESELEPDVNPLIEAMQQEWLDKMEEDHLEFNH